MCRVWVLTVVGVYGLVRALQSSAGFRSQKGLGFGLILFGFAGLISYKDYCKVWDLVVCHCKGFEIGFGTLVRRLLSG